jgi:REP element-mobilizing transposase RayT
MPRLPRLHVPGGCYHVILRGNHREALFASAADRHALNDIVADVLSRFHGRLHAFCWMSNHLHALIQVADQPLGKLMQRIAMRYSRFRHKRLRTTGHLFERRYKAKLVEVDEYFLTLLRYIHLNPVKAHIVSDPADYLWSSHRAYLGHETIPWLTVDFGLSLFAADLFQARSAYARFLSLPPNDEDLDEESHPKGSRVLGSDLFISNIPFIPYKPRSPLTLDQLVTEICMQHGISAEILCSRSSVRSLTPIRLQVLQQALDQRIATLTEVARFLNRDPSMLCKLTRKHQLKVQ